MILDEKVFVEEIPHEIKSVEPYYLLDKIVTTDNDEFFLVNLVGDGRAYGKAINSKQISQVISFPVFEETNIIVVGKKAPKWLTFITFGLIKWVKIYA